MTVNTFYIMFNHSEKHSQLVCIFIDPEKNLFPRAVTTNLDSSLNTLIQLTRVVDSTAQYKISGHEWKTTHYQSNGPCSRNRSSHQRRSLKKGFLKNFAKFTGKNLCQSPFFNKVAGLRRETYLKRDSGTGAFLWILQKILRTPF